MVDEEGVVLRCGGEHPVSLVGMVDEEDVVLRCGGEHPVSLVGMMDEEDVVLWFKDTHSLAGRNGGRRRHGVEVWR